MLYRRTTPLIDNCPLLILVRIILNVLLLKSLNPAGTFSSCLPGTDHHNQTDAQNLELHLMGDLNCNLLSEVVSNNSCHLLNIIDIQGLTLLITKPTRVTQYSCTLIDFCLTNSPDKISKSGVINIGISDHSAIYLTRKVTHLRSLICIKLWKTDSSRISMKLNFCEKMWTFGNPFQRVLLISMHYSEQKGFMYFTQQFISNPGTNALPGLLMNCYVKYI